MIAIRPSTRATCTGSTRRSLRDCRDGEGREEARRCGGFFINDRITQSVEIDSRRVPNCNEDANRNVSINPSFSGLGSPDHHQISSKK